MPHRVDAAARERQERMRSLVGENLQFVARTLRRGGVPHAEVDDEVQRTFIVAAGRLADMRLGSERSFLFQVAKHTALHARRSLARRREIPSDPLPDRSGPLETPEETAARNQAGALLDEAVSGMTEALRTVLILYAVEDMALSEIAEMLGVPRGTVASRLRRARLHLRRSLAAIELACEHGLARGQELEGPGPLRREDVGPLGRALLRAGAATRASEVMCARTLAACLALAAR
jgi:RNA polymerase sigma-70 factor (ECF subfamily)